MKNVYAYLCDTHKCENCSFPTCSHTIDESHRIHEENTEMRLLYSSDDTNYYMEFVKRGTKKFKIYFYKKGDHDGSQEFPNTMFMYVRSNDEAEKKFNYACYSRGYTFGWAEECEVKGE